MDHSSRLFFDNSACRGNMLFLGSSNSIFGGPSTTMISMEDNNVAKKRPFFSSHDDFYYDEEYYDEQLPEKKRRLTPHQVVLLEKSFEEENKLEPERKNELAKQLGLQPRQVAIWFQNRRARSKTKQLERDYDRLKASYDSLVSSYDSILKENDMLKSEVNSLTEKLQAEGRNVGGPISNKVQDSLPFNGPAITAQHQLTKAEDRISSGSGASAVTNEEHPQVVDSGDSYFDCLPPPAPYIAAVQSEDDDISDDGRSYFSTIFTAAPEHGHHEGHDSEGGQDLGWWVWS